MEKPILFNTDLVRAILDGRKTVTRRIVKNIPLHAPYFEVVDGEPMACDEYGDWHPATDFSWIWPEDILWVRETWAHPSAAEISMGADTNMYIYKADEPALPCAYDRWRPSIHMPREAARLFLRVTDVRIERLQDMVAEDCAKDGGYEPEAVKAVGVAPLFGPLWDSTIKKADLPRYGWDANPWVWVIEFERTEIRG